MGEATTIEWTDHTFNPWRGCTKVSPGCANCYAEAMARRNPKVLGEWGPGGTRVVAAESYWRQPLKWDREAREADERRRVFCASLADVFEDRDDLIAPRARLLRTIYECRNLDWLLLTKRPENWRKLVEESLTEVVMDDDHDPGLAATLMLWLNGDPPPNVWLGVSAEDQRRADERIPQLHKIPAKIKFLSVEPMLGPIETERSLYGYDWDLLGGEEWSPALARRHGSISWVICGGESGPNARPFDIRWARSLRDRCATAGVPFFMKQLGAKPIETRVVAGGVTGTLYGAVDNLRLRDPKGGDWGEWPEDLRVREWPKVD